MAAESLGARHRHDLAALLYAGTSLVSLAMGATYMFRGSFMPYHAAALGRSWIELDPATQTLLKALMEVAAGGWFALGVLVLLLVAIPIRRGERWARLAAPAAITLFYVPTLLATLGVALQTGAATPWLFNAMACLCAFVGVLLDTPWRPLRGHPAPQRDAPVPPSPTATPLPNNRPAGTISWAAMGSVSTTSRSRGADRRASPGNQPPYP